MIRVALIGGRLDGQAGVVLDMLSYHDEYQVSLIFDSTIDSIGTSKNGIPYVGNFNEYYDHYSSEYDVVHIAIGDNRARDGYAKFCIANNIELLTIIHPSAVVSRKSTVSAGCFIGPNVVIQNGAKIGLAAIVNTAAIIEHDCIIGDFVHIAPGTVLAGRVTIQERSFVGIGSCIIPDIIVGNDAFIGAGSVVTHDLGSDTFAIGVPARVRDNIYDRKNK